MKDLNAQMTSILNSYREDVIKYADEAGKQVAKECVEKLRTSSPKGGGKNGGEYAENWTSKSEKRKGLKIGTHIVYNKKPTYRLTHLLEKGHVIRNQYGTWGHTSPKPHIAPVEEWGVVEYEQRIKDKLQ